MISISRSPFVSNQNNVGVGDLVFTGIVNAQAHGVPTRIVVFTHCLVALAYFLNFDFYLSLLSVLAWCDAEFAAEDFVHSHCPAEADVAGNVFDGAFAF